MRDSHDLAAEVREQAARELAQVERECDERRQSALVWCRRSRDEVREDRDIRLASEASRRRKAARAYTRLRKDRRLPPADFVESDSLASHSIPDELLTLWEKERHRFPYDLSPDRRAEMFMEWTEEHPDEVTESLADAFDDFDPEPVPELDEVPF